MQLTRFYGCGFVMAFRGNILVFFLLGIQQKIFIAVTDRADGKININIAIFFNASDRVLRSIVQNSKVNFLASQRGNNLLNENLTIYDNPWWQDMTNSGRSQIGLNDSLSVVWNISSKIQGAIFVDINSDSIFLSSLLERSGIPTIGAFQRGDQLRTQESPADFTRVAVPSIKYYAQVIWEFMKKIERSSLCLVLSADSDGEALADSMARMAKDEKWLIKKVIWLAGNGLVSIETEIESIISQQSDVVVVHSRDKDNDPLFQAMKKFNATGSIWILTHITEYGISHLDVLPAGLIKIKARKREVNLDGTLYSDAIYDAFLLFQTAFMRAQSKTPDQMEGTEDPCFEANTNAKEIQDLVKIHLRETFIEGRSSMFMKPSLYEKSETTFEIWNLRVDVSGAKKWTLIGLSTPTGLALDTFMGPNGSVITAPTVPVTHTLRVPINEYYPWVQIEDPRLDSRGMHYCTGRSQLCYKFYNSSRMDKTTLCCFGVSIDLLVMMQNDLGFRSEIYFTPDGNYGDFDEEKQAWNGIVQEVLSGQAEFAIDISMNAIRQEYLDFANPFIHLALNILVLKDLEANEEIQWNSWLEPFQYQLWFSILGFINFILIVIWWIDRKSPMGHRMKKDSGDDGFTLLDSMTYVWGVAFGKDIGAEKTPHSGSARCVSAFFAFFALIVVNTYCANLMAFLVQEKFELPISGIRDAKIRHPSLTPPKGFRLGIQKDSQEASYFKFHSEDIFREIYHVNLQVNLVNNFADGLEKLKNREIHGLVGDYLSLSQVANNDENCSYSLAGPNFFNFGLGLALRKGSPWLQDVNQAVLKHQENGSIKAIENRWFNKKSCDLKPFNRLGIINFSGLFMAIVFVIAFCVLAVFVEVCVVVLMIKFGDKLGTLGKFAKRFVFNVKKGEEDQLDMQYSFLVRRHQNATWDVGASHVVSTDLEELGFHNNQYTFPKEQPMTLGDMNRNGTIHDRLHENGDVTMNGVADKRKHERTNGRTKSFKLNGMVTKL